MLPVIPYGSVGAIIAFIVGAIFRAIASGAMLSAPFAVTPCGSSVPVGNMTVFTLTGTTSLNSIQLIRFNSQVEGLSLDACAKTASDAQRQNNRAIHMLDRFISSLLFLMVCLNHKDTKVLCVFVIEYYTDHQQD